MTAITQKRRQGLIPSETLNRRELGQHYRCDAAVAQWSERLAVDQEAEVFESLQLYHSEIGPASKLPQDHSRGSPPLVRL